MKFRANEMEMSTKAVHHCNVRLQLYLCISPSPKGNVLFAAVCICIDKLTYTLFFLKYLEARVPILVNLKHTCRQEGTDENDVQNTMTF